MHVVMLINTNIQSVTNGPHYEFSQIKMNYTQGWIFTHELICWISLSFAAVSGAGKHIMHHFQFHHSITQLGSVETHIFYLTVHFRGDRLGSIVYLSAVCLCSHL